jgi:predicted RNA methylase
MWLELNPRTGQNYLNGKGELAVQQALAARIQPGEVFYDLGANIGLFSLMAARLVGASGEVYSFEPDPVNAARLRRNVAQNRLTNVTVVEHGVWSSSCKT